MAQTLEEQISIVERALSECMIDTALVVVRSWLNELGENNPYEEAFRGLQEQQDKLFVKWLNVDDVNDELELQRLTGIAYQLVDEVYADIRLARGVSPDMHGFNRDSVHSSMNYFLNCVRFRPEDLEWYNHVLNDEGSNEMAMVLVASLAQNLRTAFNLDSFLAFIEGMNAKNDMAASMSASFSALLIVQYDARVDFFPQLQDAFVNAIAEEDSADRMFDLICSLVKNERVFRVMPGFSEEEYLSQIIPLIPQSWLYTLLIEGSNERERRLAYYMIKAGFRDPMWEYQDIAEQVFVDKLRGGSSNPMDFINYAHCLWLRGDRMMAYENYRQARQLCGSHKEFFALFRPDRKELVDHGIPMEHVYQMEDRLIKS